ncbi:peptidase [Burkholderia phage BcepSaruman]|uniref:Uncharacterized protein n=1 Tax=Burkholderia phage BcepSaruman TaxID=2530032 RepID=A0A4D5ZC92_9CAUD|nr:peptidase [Burkholderia phage BcepSaruman]QBX06643.1 hypothetical protein BcepSaruman_230 [Burkholderia phage BcepSaruman]
MNVQKGDYIIGKVDKKTHLIKVDSIHKGIASGLEQKDAHIPQLARMLEFNADSIIANLGPEPKPGRAFGCDTTRRYVGRKTHEHFQRLYWFYKPEGDAGERVVRAFDKAYKVLKKNGLDFIIQPETCVWEITPPNGERYAGMYKRSSKPEKNPHRLIIRPEVMEEKDWAYVIYHELAGHHLHYEFLTGSKLEGAWVKLYNRSVKVSVVKKEDCARILEDFLGQETRLSDYKGQLGEDDAEALKWILKAIKTNHKISLSEIDLLFAADYADDIRAIWPQRVSRVDLEPLVTEYALKNYKELIAESIAWYLSGLQLPKDVTKLVEKTLAYVKANHE